MSVRFERQLYKLDSIVQWEIGLMARSLTMVIVGWIAIASAPLVHLHGAGLQQQSSKPRPLSAASHREVLTRYCVTCHNERLKTAGLTLDSVDVAKVSEGAEVWEKVVRKLRTGAMPPVGMPRPDQDTADALAAWLEGELDRAASAKPDPGKLPNLHRLSRTEYQSAIRDLLALDNLPREMDIATLLPADNSSSGFDNLADLLFVSPTIMERYLSAARKISRMAVGDPSFPVIVDTYRLPFTPVNMGAASSAEPQQDVHLDELPFGTRGGILINSYYPLDGEYAVKIEFVGKAREPHELEVSVDGERVRLVTIPLPADRPKVQAKGFYEDEPDKALELRLAMKAGPRAVGVTFVEKTSALGEEMVRRRGSRLPSLASVTISGPYSSRGPGDTPSRRRIFVCRPAKPSEEAPCAEQILSTLARRAYRRPVTEVDLQDLLPFYAAGRAEEGFDTGIQRALERLLVSPQFLFRVERDAAVANGPHRISDLELASRLSFFLWSSIPDDELLAVATQGQLKDPAVLEQQVLRMLADDRSHALVTNFAAQWLYLRDILEKRPDQARFPDFDDSLRQAFLRETELFFGSILRENRSVLDLLSANYTFVNERLAKHYAIPNVYGSHFRRITFDDGSVRGGLLAQGSILALTAYANRTSPVLRGKWILDNILAAPPPPPPPNIPALKETTTTGKALSMREAMVQHRANPVCASCHARMDPLGFALENFDAVGRWRTRSESGEPIDAAAVLDGNTFEGLPGLRKFLMNRPEQFVKTVTEKLLTYAIGRNLDYYDAPAVRQIARAAARADFSLSSLILGVVKSTPFQMRKPAAAAEATIASRH
jgi:mono/diheme cytochrome c family protein